MQRKIQGLKWQIVKDDLGLRAEIGNGFHFFLHVKPACFDADGEQILFFGKGSWRVAAVLRKITIKGFRSMDERAADSLRATTKLKMLAWRMEHEMRVFISGCNQGWEDVGEQITFDNLPKGTKMAGWKSYHVGHRIFFRYSTTATPERHVIFERRTSTVGKNRNWSATLAVSKTMTEDEARALIERNLLSLSGALGVLRGSTLRYYMERFEEGIWPIIVKGMAGKHYFAATEKIRDLLSALLEEAQE